MFRVDGEERHGGSEKGRRAMNRVELSHSVLHNIPAYMLFSRSPALLPSPIAKTAHEGITDAVVGGGGKDADLTRDGEVSETIVQRRMVTPRRARWREGERTKGEVEWRGTVCDLLAATPSLYCGHVH